MFTSHLVYRKGATLVPFRVRVTHGGLVSVWTVAKKKKKKTQELLKALVPSSQSPGLIPGVQRAFETRDTSSQEDKEDQQYYQ